MNAIDTFWTVTIALILAFFFFSVREYVLMHRFPPKHPERGLYVFNACIFFVLSVGVLCGALYLDYRKAPLEAMIETYPDARFDPIASVMAKKGVWIYRTDADEKAIMDFFQSYARRMNKKIFQDSSSGDLVLLVMDDHGRMFVTIREEEGIEKIYYSIEGQVTVITL